MKRVKIIGLLLIVGLALLLTLECAAAKKKPGWITDPAGEYPVEKYIVSVGSGDTRESAGNNARGEIAKVIQLEIKVKEKIVDDVIETGAGEALDMKRSSRIYSRVNVQTDQSLKNVNIAKMWLSEEDARYYALAYLDRNATADIYRVELAKVDSEVSSYVQGARECRDKVTRLAFLQKALLQAAYRDILAQQMLTITEGRARFRPDVAYADLVNTREELLTGVGVKVALDDSGWEEFGSSVKEVLASHGFQIVQSDPDILLTGKLIMTQLKRKGFHIGWYVELHLKDVASRTEFLTFSEEGREGHRSYPEAERLAIRSVREKILKDFDRKIDDHLNSLISG